MDIWVELEKICGKADDARVSELKKEFAHIAQCALDITLYFNKIKQLWDEIVVLSISHVNSCTCGARSDYQKDEDVQGVYQFLIGLNDTYAQTRSNILMLKPFPSISIIYSMLLYDEKQRQISTTSQFSSTSASFNTGSSRQSYTSNVTFDSQKLKEQNSRKSPYKH